MKTVVVSTKKKLPAPFTEKTAELVSPAALQKAPAGPASPLYLDLAGLSAAELKKALAVCKKRSLAWGILDGKGAEKDPARWFFEGACDYLGPAALKTGVTAKRLKSAASWRTSALAQQPGAAASAGPAAGGLFSRGPLKLPAEEFPGWKNIQRDRHINAFLLYASIRGKTALASRLGEAAYAAAYKRFLQYLAKNLQDAEGLLWMDTGKDCLALLPSKEKCAATAVVSCLRMLISAPMFTVENLNLAVPVNFVFALHYGGVTFKPPGSTGTVVSDAVNYIFHLGAKRAEPGRLTVSAAVPDCAVSPKLEDLFVKAGVFEGQEIVQSKPFVYPKLWM